MALTVQQLSAKVHSCHFRSVAQHPPKPSYEAVLAKRLALQCTYELPCTRCAHTALPADAPESTTAEEDLELVSEPSPPSEQAGSMSDREASPNGTASQATEGTVAEEGSSGQSHDGSESLQSGEDGSADDEADSDEGGGPTHAVIDAARQTSLRVFSRRDGARLGAGREGASSLQVSIEDEQHGAVTMERDNAMPSTDEGQEDADEADAQSASSLEDEEGAGAVEVPQGDDDAVNAVQRLLQGARKDGQRMSKAAMARAARFYEMEAELSDEDGEGGQAVVSDDEDENDEDGGRDLVRCGERGVEAVLEFYVFHIATLVGTCAVLSQADLIDARAPGDVDDVQQKQLHAVWEAEQEASALRRLVQGVKHGFKRVGDDFGVGAECSGKWRITSGCITSSWS